MVATIRIFEALATYTIENDKGDYDAAWMDLLWQIGSAVQTLPTLQIME